MRKVEYITESKFVGVASRSMIWAESILAATWRKGKQKEKRKGEDVRKEKKRW